MSAGTMDLLYTFEPALFHCMYSYVEIFTDTGILIDGVIKMFYLV